jgi:hypothetical protein
MTNNVGQQIRNNFEARQPSQQQEYVGGGVNPRKSGGENACLHGSKRENAALTAMHQRIAPPPRQGCASPGCIRPQPALDPATGRFFIAHAQHFLCQKKTFRQIYADFDRHQQE